MKTRTKSAIGFDGVADADSVTMVLEAARFTAAACTTGEPAACATAEATDVEPSDDEVLAEGVTAATERIAADARQAADRALAEALAPDAAGARLTPRASGRTAVACRDADDGGADGESVASAWATAGKQAISDPTPRANASAPTRPTF